MPSYFHIAIDGPVAAGKSTVTKLLADRLGFAHIDTGAMYRAVALAAMKMGINLNDELEVAKILPDLQIRVRAPENSEKDGRLSTVFLDGEDVSWKIRETEVSKNVPIIAAMPEVRSALVSLQQAVAKEQNVVMEGRDITYRVLPSANLKIYLTASTEERINRQLERIRSTENLHNDGELITREQIASNLRERDHLDKTRKTDPLKIVDDAWVLDTSDLSIEQVVQTIVDRVEEMSGGTASLKI